MTLISLQPPVVPNYTQTICKYNFSSISVLVDQLFDRKLICKYFDNWFTILIVESMFF